MNPFDEGSSSEKPEEPAQKTPQEPLTETPSEEPARWEDLGLSESTLKLIKDAGFKSPTPVQAKTIPLALQGRDVIASAQTGTGKTASFVLPMVERFAGKEGTFALILAPTREIAQQIQGTLDIFAKPQGLRSIVLIGGINMRIDAEAIQTYPQIIVATPGRLCDHLERGNIWLDFIQMVVMDEADRMLAMGFADQLSRIMNEVPNTRQTMIFSATFPPSVEKLARKSMQDPERISIGKPTVTAVGVEQKIIWMKDESKSRELNRLLKSEKGTIVVFTRSKERATQVWRSLHSRGVYDATYIHSDRLQSHREQALAEFKEGKYRILVATDVAGRGIHVDDVALVINYDLPMESEDYIHRIGRTGRQGASGRAVTFATPHDSRKIRMIEELTHQSIPAEFADDVRPGDRSSSSDRGGGRSGDRGSRGGRGGERGGRGGSRGASRASSGGPSPIRPNEPGAGAASGEKSSKPRRRGKPSSKKT